MAGDLHLSAGGRPHRGEIISKYIISFAL
jgi:hypothetical protein